MEDKLKSKVVELAHLKMDITETAKNTTGAAASICNKLTDIGSKGFNDALHVLYDEGETESFSQKWVKNLSDTLKVLKHFEGESEIVALLKEQGINVSIDVDDNLESDNIPKKELKSIKKKMAALLGDDTIPSSKSQLMQILIEKVKDSFTHILGLKQDFKNKVDICQEDCEVDKSSINVAVSITTLTRKGFSDKAMTASEKITSKSEAIIEIAKESISI